MAETMQSQETQATVVKPDIDEVPGVHEGCWLIVEQINPETGDVVAKIEGRLTGWVCKGIQHYPVVKVGQPTYVTIPEFEEKHPGKLYTPRQTRPIKKIDGMSDGSYMLYAEAGEKKRQYRVWFLPQDTQPEVASHKTAEVRISEERAAHLADFQRRTQVLRGLLDE